MAGFQKDSDQPKTALSHYHRPHRRHCHLHLHVHLHRHHQHVYVRMHECMHVYAMDALGPSVSVSKLLSSLPGMVEDARVTTEPGTW